MAKKEKPEINPNLDLNAQLTAAFMQEFTYLNEDGKRAGSLVSRVVRNRDLTRFLETSANNVQNNFEGYLYDATSVDMKAVFTEAKGAREDSDKQGSGNFERLLHNGLTRVNKQLDQLFRASSNQFNPQTIERVQALRRVNNEAIAEFRGNDPNFERSKRKVSRSKYLPVNPDQVSLDGQLAIAFRDGFKYLNDNGKRSGNPLARHVNKDLTTDLENAAREISRDIEKYIADPNSFDLQALVERVQTSRSEHGKKAGTFEKMLHQGLVNMNKQMNVLMRSGSDKVNPQTIERLLTIRQTNVALIDNLRDFDPKAQSEADTQSRHQGPRSS